MQRDQVENLTLLGSGKMPKVDAPSIEILETFPNRFPERPYIINFTFPEFTSLCPVTGQPDLGCIILEYIPDALCVESKSFKLYMFAFRNHHSFMETIVNNMLTDFVTLLDPAWCRVKGLFKARGGVTIDVFAEEFKDLPKEKSEIIQKVVDSWKREVHIYNK